MRNEQEHARELDRAYVQSRVIENGLEQLAMTLEHVDPALREDVSSCADHFDSCVRHLRDAQQRVSDGGRRRDTAVAGKQPPNW